MSEVIVRRACQAALAGALWCSVLPLYAAPPWLHVEGNQIKDPSGNDG